MDFFDKLQRLFGITKSELTVSFVILLGLLIGSILNFTNDSNIAAKKKAIYKSLDSLAEYSKINYTGTDIRDNSYNRIKKFNKRKNKSHKKIYGKININTASKLELMKLPGVGSKTALKIIAYRKSISFYNPEDIMNIKGIGKKKFEKMKNYILVR